MGVIGAAVASGLGQVLSVLVLLSHFVRRKGSLRIAAFRIDFKLVKKICKRGVPEAVTQLTTPVTALCYNLMLANLVGDIGVSTYSILSFIYSLANAILSGVAQGLQPLWGQCYGKQDTAGMGWYFRCGMIINEDLDDLAENISSDSESVHAAVRYLEKLGFIEYGRSSESNTVIYFLLSHKGLHQEELERDDPESKMLEELKKMADAAQEQAAAAKEQARLAREDAGAAREDARIARRQGSLLEYAHKFQQTKDELHRLLQEEHDNALNQPLQDGSFTF